MAGVGIFDRPGRRVDHRDHGRGEDLVGLAQVVHDPLDGSSGVGHPAGQCRAQQLFEPQRVHTSRRPVAGHIAHDHPDPAAGQVHRIEPVAGQLPLGRVDPTAHDQPGRVQSGRGERVTQGNHGGSLLSERLPEPVVLPDEAYQLRPHRLNVAGKIDQLLGPDRGDTGVITSGSDRVDRPTQRGDRPQEPATCDNTQRDHDDRDQEHRCTQ